MNFNEMAKHKKLEIGQYCTVEFWHPIKLSEVSAFLSSTKGEGMKIPKAYVGDILKIHAVDYPFIVVEIMAGLTSIGKRRILDLRKLELKILSDEFVNAATVKQED